jgi:hypothetical protein
MPERVVDMPANKNKKSEREFYAKARNTWSRKPVTQVVSNGKAYNRKKAKMEFHRTLKRGDDGIFFVSLHFARVSFTL